MRRVLSIATYRRLLIAYTLNELAWSIGSLALAILVYRRTGSAVGSMGFFLCSQFVPALLSPALVARLDRHVARRVLTTLYAFEALLFGALAWIASHFSLAPALALVVLDGWLAVSARAIARAAVVHVTRPADLLREGNALANASFSVCFALGPAIGAAIVSLANTSTALLVNVGLFAVMAGVLGTATGLSAEKVRRGRPSRLSTALAYVTRRRPLRILFVLEVAGLLFFTISIPVEIVFVKHSLHAGTKAYGALLSVWGVGTIGGSVIYARWRTATLAALITSGSAALGLGFVVMASAPSTGVAVVGAAAAGVGNGVWAVAIRTALQEEIDDSWMTMMMSFNESIFQVVPGAGIALGGAMAGLAGPRAALAVGGGGALLVALVAWLVLRPRRAAVTLA
jgi:predicted MFS family arabinose efflux permease